MARSFDILQQIRNRVDTCQVGWERFAEAAIPQYNTAFKNHTNALKAAQAAIKREQEEGWLVLGMVLGLTAGFWVPRFLKPVGQSFADDLVKEWVSLPIREGLKEFSVHVGTELGKEVLSHAEKQLKVGAKEIVSQKSDNAYEPVVEDTVDWGGRLKEGIKDRAFILKSGLDEVIKNADSWSLPAAEFMQKAFFKFCPFIVDMPGDTDGDFKANFLRMSELSMWRAWGIVRDKKWWQDNPNHKDQLKMASIFDRMVQLGIPAHEVANYQNWSGTSIASARRPGWRFDMLKFIAWSEKFDPKQLPLWKKQVQETEQMCRIVDHRLVLKKQQNVCYPGGVY